MGLDLSSLSDFTRENSGILISDSVIKAKTIQESAISIQTGVKNTDSINRLENTINLQSGDCISTPSGTTKLTQRSISVCPFTHYDEKCLDNFEDKWTSELMSRGSNNESLPFEQLYTEHVTEQINKEIEDIAWRGDTTSSTHPLSLCDGWLKQIDDDSSNTILINSGNSKSYSAFTTSNAISIIDEMVDNIDEEVVENDDLTLFISRSQFNTLVRAYRDLNNFSINYQTQNESDGRIMLPGYDNIQVQVAPGLRTTNRIVLTPASNLFYGTDLENDKEDFRMFYDEQKDVLVERIKFKIGFNHAFGKYVVHYDQDG